jgi:hypothetical protein
MAAEAALRVRVDGEPLADVAAELGRPVERWGRFLEEMDSDLRGHLLSAAAGEILGPFEAPDGHELLVVESRRSPQPDDPVVHAHAEQRLFQSVVDRAMESVRWEGPLKVARG